MKIRDVVDAVVGFAKMHPMLTELLAAFIVGVMVGGLVFG